MCDFCENLKPTKHWTYDNKGGDIHTTFQYMQLYNNQLWFGCSSNIEKYHPFADELEGFIDDDKIDIGANNVNIINYCPICGRKLEDNDNSIIVFSIFDNINNEYKRNNIISDIYPYYRKITYCGCINNDYLTDDQNYKTEYAKKHAKYVKRFIENEKYDFINKIKKNKNDIYKIIYLQFYNTKYNTYNIDDIIDFLCNEFGYSSKLIVDGRDLNNLEDRIKKALKTKV